MPLAQIIVPSLAVNAVPSTQHASCGKPKEQLDTLASLTMHMGKPCIVHAQQAGELGQPSQGSPFPQPSDWQLLTVQVLALPPAWGYCRQQWEEQA